MTVLLIILPIALIYRNYRYGYKISFKNENSKELYISPIIYRLLYPGKTYKTISLLGLIYQCIVVIPSVILAILTIYLYFILIGILAWTTRVNGQFLVNTSITLYIYIGAIDVIYEGILKRYCSRKNNV
jgi:hypothetical protein